MDEAARIARGEDLAIDLRRALLPLGIVQNGHSVTMDEPEARSIGEREIAAMQAEYDRIATLKGLSAPDVQLVVTSVERISRTWCVFYNNRRFVDGGGVELALAGNGPILVSDDGRVGVAGSALPTEHFVAEFERA